jgi:hypothetical protein
MVFARGRRHNKEPVNSATKYTGMLVEYLEHGGRRPHLVVRDSGDKLVRLDQAGHERTISREIASNASRSSWAKLTAEERSAQMKEDSRSALAQAQMRLCRASAFVRSYSRG